MGQRSRTETVVAVLSAFHRRKKWTQAELARSIGVGTEALRKVLEELQAEAFPLVSDTDRPHVYWKMSNSWCPGGILFKKEDVPELVRQLGRLPRSKARDGLLDVVVDQLPAKGKLLPVPPVASRVLSDQEEQYLPIVEDGAARKVPLFFKYVTASKGVIGERRASVHWIDLGPPARFVATCHRTGELRWFRVDRILHGRVDAGEPFRPSAAAAVEAFCATSLDGYKGSGGPIVCSFFVRDPEARWVANNLLDGMRVEALHDGIRVSLEKSAVIRLARFVVGLGAAAQPENPELAKVVVELARGALEHLASRTLELATDSPAPATKPARPSSDV